MATFIQLTERVKDWANRSDIENDIIKDFLDIAVKRVNNVLRIPPMETIVTYANVIDGQTNFAIPSDLIEIITFKVIDKNKNTVMVFNNKIGPRSFDSQVQNGGTTCLPSYTRRAGDLVISTPVTVEASVAEADRDKFELYYYRLLPALNATFPDTATNKGLLLPSGDASITTNGVTATASAAACTAVSGTFTTTCDTDSYPNSIVGNEVPNWFRDEQDDLLLYGALAELFNYLGEEMDAQRWEVKYENKLSELQEEEHKREFKGGTITVNIGTGGLI